MDGMDGHVTAYKHVTLDMSAARGPVAYSQQLLAILGARQHLELTCDLSTTPRSDPPSLVCGFATWTCTRAFLH